MFLFVASYTYNKLATISKPRHAKICFYMCKNNGTDQLPGNQRLCFRHIDSIISKFEVAFSHLCGRTDRFVSDLVGNPDDMFFASRLKLKAKKMIPQTFN